MEFTTTIAIGLMTGGIWQIVGQSSLFGQLILIILVCFSMVSWGIMYSKWRLFKKVTAESDAFLKAFRKAGKLSTLVNTAKAFQYTPLSGVFLQGYEETKKLLDLRQPDSDDMTDAKPLRHSDIEMVAMTLERVASEEIADLERKVVFLATTANASPFLGLMGTVVGIMDAFWSIGERGSASLAVVAPGIAEALLATIVGLGAAIPAVVGYNWANNRLKKYFDQASNFALEFQVRIKRDLAE